MTLGCTLVRPAPKASTGPACLSRVCDAEGVRGGVGMVDDGGESCGDGPTDLVASRELM